MKHLTISISVRTACLVVGAGVCGFCLAPLVARATASPSVAPTLSFAGTLQRDGLPIAGAQALKFAFKKNGVTVCTSDLTATPDETGQFTVAIPISACPTSLFDGSEVKLDVSVGGNLAIADQSITSVPSARFADQVGFSDCPTGYDRDSSTSDIVICKRGYDEVVRVGTKSTAFWIDRYEDSVWSDPDATGTQFGDNAIDFPITNEGQTPQKGTMYAVSKTNVRPSRYVSWFQANVACRSSGKRLPTGDEWLLAAQNTPDPGTADGTHGECNTAGILRKTGGGTACVSIWGAQDMIGNLTEWTTEWQASPSVLEENRTVTWGPAMGNDTIANVASGASSKWGTWSSGLPAATSRGGSVYFGEGAGIFTYLLGLAPNFADGQVTLRCVVPR